MNPQAVPDILHELPCGMHYSLGQGTVDCKCQCCSRHGLIHYYD